jgi:hypothetical protein
MTIPINVNVSTVRPASQFSERGADGGSRERYDLEGAASCLDVAPEWLLSRRPAVPSSSASVTAQLDGWVRLSGEDDRHDW